MNILVEIRESPGIVSPAKGAIERRDDLDDVRSRERVMDALSIAARLDKIVCAQSRELLRHGRLAYLQNLLELVDGLFSVDQQTKNEKTGLVRNCLEEIARLSRVVEHGVGVDRRFCRKALLPLARR
jgi:hypothetical protein